MKKCNEFRYKCKNCKYAHIKKYEKQEMNLITKKCVHNYDCVTIVMTYVKNIDLTIRITNVFSNLKDVRRNCYSPVPNCRGVCNSSG